MKLKSKLVKIVTVATLTLILSACGGNGKDKQNSDNGLFETPTTTNDTNTTTTDSNGSDDNSTNGSGDDNSSSGGDNNSTDGNGDNNSTNGNGDDNSTNPSATIKTLNLKVEKATLNKDTNTTISVKAIYKDNTIKDITNKAKWIIDKKDAIKITNHTLKALKDTNVTLQAKVGKVISNPAKLVIYWEVNGHRLPPEPDPKINNSTLLGVDVNHNGVRDDVERWIYKKYKDKHPIHIDIAMQAGRAYKLVLEHPEKAKEIRLKVNGALFCGWYYQKDAYRYNDPTLVHERIDAPVKSKYFNTKARQDVYWEYDKTLSGDAYDLPRSKQRKALCDFNTSKYEE